MKMWTIVFLAAVLGVATRAVAEEREPPHMQFVVHLRLVEGKKFGNPDEYKVLAEPTLVTVINRPCSCNLGGSIPIPGTMPQRYEEFGRKIQFTPLELNDDNVQFDINLLNKTLVAAGDKQIRFQSSHLHHIAAVRLGDMEMFDWEQAPGEKPTWIEYSVDVVKPGDAQASSDSSPVKYLQSPRPASR